MSFPARFRARRAFLLGEGVSLLAVPRSERRVLPMLHLRAYGAR